MTHPVPEVYTASGKDPTGRPRPRPNPCRDQLHDKGGVPGAVTAEAVQAHNVGVVQLEQG